MRAVLVIFVVCLIAKDVAFAPAPYIIRGAAQALCLLAGLAVLTPTLTARMILRYWPILGYLVVLLATAPFTKFPAFACLQVLSLASAVVFSMAYFEGFRETNSQKLKFLVGCIVAVYAVTAYASLVMIKIQPGLAYESLFAGNMTGSEVRFRGVFSQAGVMAAGTGLLVGLAAIRARRLPLKLLLLGPGLICLVLTQSRSFWVAAFLAGLATFWLYYPRVRRWIYVAFVIGALGVWLPANFGVSVDASGVVRFARLSSLTTLTGRTELWQTAYQGWSRRPLLGYGFTLGGLGTIDPAAVTTDSDPMQYSRMTLHNGYVQSVMDAGLIGFFFYVATILVALARVIRFDEERHYPEALYVLLYLAIANGGESVIYSGSVFQSLCFWVFAVFALHLKPSPEREPASTSPQTNSLSGPSIDRWPNLLR